MNLNVFKLLLICSIFLFACNENRIYEEHQDPTGNLEWKNGEKLSFDVDIPDASLDYQVILALRYSRGFMFTNLPVQVTRTDPDGNTSTKNHVFNPRNSDGEYIGDGSGDIWDLEDVFEEKTRFAVPGKYHYEVMHTMDIETVHFVMEVGLIVDKIPTNQQ